MNPKTLLLSCIFILSPVIAHAGNCGVLETTKSSVSTRIEFESISRPGCYKAQGDLVNLQPEIVEYRPSESDMLALFSGEVKIDLDGKRMIGRRGATGGIIAVMRRRYGGVEILNGTIESTDRPAIALLQADGGEMYSQLSDFDQSDPERAKAAWAHFQRFQSRRSASFADTANRLKGLELKSTAAQYVVGIQGGKNIVIRNTIIAVNSTVGLYIFGPDNVIENNTIIFESYDGDSVSAAPIKLYHADRSVLRNNKIIIKRGKGGVDAAISILQSKDIVLENNTVSGVDREFKLWDAESSVKRP